MNEWTHKGKMSINPDQIVKMVKIVLFSRKNVQSSQFQKHLGLVLNSKLNFDILLRDKKYYCK